MTTAMIKLTGYEPPAKGQHYTTNPIWVNLNLVAHMSTYSAWAEREDSGKFIGEKVDVTSITFAAAFAEEQIGVSVMETPAEILSSTRSKP